MRDRAGDLRPDRVLRLRRRRPGRARGGAARGDAPDGRRRRPGRLHAAAHAGRRLPLRPDDHAARRGALPRRHRRRARDGRPEVVRRPPAGGRRRADRRPHLDAGARSASGGRGRATSSASTTGDDVSHEGFPFATCRTIEVGLAAGAGLADLLRRRPRLGAVRADRAGRQAVGHGLGGRASRTASCPAGIGVYGTTGRLEKCYRAFGFELDGEYDVVEAGMAWGKVKEQDFVGKEAHVRQRESEPAAVMCTLTVDDHTLGERAQALHARRRADRHARRRAADRRARAAARSSPAPAPGRRSASTS